MVGGVDGQGTSSVGKIVKEEVRADCGMLHAVKYPTWAKPPRWQIERLSPQTLILGVNCMEFMFLHFVVSVLGCAEQRVFEAM